MELPADVADPLDQRPLDVHVDVFELDRELEAALLDFLADLGQGLLNLAALVGGQQADLGEHLGVGDRAGDVLRIEPPVEAHALGELLDAAVGRLVEHPTPRLLCHPSPREKGTPVLKRPEGIYCKHLRAKCQRADATPLSMRRSHRRRRQKSDTRESVGDESPPTSRSRRTNHLY